MVKVEGKNAIIALGGKNVDVALMKDKDMGVSLGFRFMESPEGEEVKEDTVYLSFASVESIEMMMHFLKKLRKARIKEGKSVV